MFIPTERTLTKQRADEVAKNAEKFTRWTTWSTAWWTFPLIRANEHRPGNIYQLSKINSSGIYQELSPSSHESDTNFTGAVSCLPLPDNKACISPTHELGICPSTPHICRVCPVGVSHAEHPVYWTSSQWSLKYGGLVGGGVGWIRVNVSQQKETFGLQMNFTLDPWMSP